MVVSTESNKEGAYVSFPAATITGNCGISSYSKASGSFFRIGSHSIISTASDGQKCSFTITVTDNESPTLSALSLSEETIWPANNKMKKVSVYYIAADNAQDVKTTLSVSSNATDGTRDWEITDDHLLRLKASRLPDGTPRIYTITVVATDEAGNTTTRTTTIAVSKTMKAVAGR